MPKLIITVSLIVGIGAVLGVVGYFWAVPESEVIVNDEIENEEIEDDIEEGIITEIKYVCEQETNKNKNGCYIRSARIIALTDYNKAKTICGLTSEPRKDDCNLQILAVADIGKLKEKCEDAKDRTEKEQCYNILILKVSETDFNEAVKLCEIKSLSKDNCYASVAEKISFTRSTEIYSKALTICDKIDWQELKESCKENCKWNYEYEQEYNETTDWKIYQNKEYGFEINLLESWRGYKVLEESWKGTTLDGNSTKYDGPKIVIRNSKWSESEIWQDIPILVFTKFEWQLIENKNLNIFAAPIAPSKLGENNKYVFSLPPRWVGFTDVLGQDEAQKIVRTFKAITLNELSD